MALRVACFFEYDSPWIDQNRPIQQQLTCQVKTRVSRLRWIKSNNAVDYSSMLRTSVVLLAQWAVTTTCRHQSRLVPIPTHLVCTATWQIQHLQIYNTAQHYCTLPMQLDLFYWAVLFAQRNQSVYTFRTLLQRGCIYNYSKHLTKTEYAAPVWFLCRIHRQTGWPQVPGSAGRTRESDAEVPSTDVPNHRSILLGYVHFSYMRDTHSSPSGRVRVGCGRVGSGLGSGRVANFKIMDHLKLINIDGSGRDECWLGSRAGRVRSRFGSSGLWLIPLTCLSITIWCWIESESFISNHIHAIQISYIRLNMMHDINQLCQGGYDWRYAWL